MDEARTANALTLAGSIPFVVLTLLTFGDGYSLRVDVSTVLLFLYASAILSFLGGIRFGMEVRSPTDGANANLVWSVVPSLAAWGLAAVTYIAAISGSIGFVGWALLLFAVLFVLQYVWDAASARSGEAPLWFGAMRRRITLIVVPTLVIAAFAAWSHY